MKQLTFNQRDEQLLDRRDMRRSLIQRRESSKSQTRQLEIDVAIGKVERQIRELLGNTQ